MEKLVELNIDPSILVSSTILNEEKPDFVYIPIAYNSKILVRQNEEVKIGTPIIKTADSTILSSVSGKITKIKKMKTINGEEDTIEILNNFEEETEAETKTKRTLSKIKKENFEEILNQFHVDLEKKKNLVLNCMDDEPYVLSESFYLYLNHEEFLELLDELSKKYQLENIIIAIKSCNSMNINQLLDNLGMYPNIRLTILPNLYLLGRKEFLLKHLNLKEEETCIINSSNFYHINNKIKKNKTMRDKLITISGNNLKNPSVIKVKLGSKLKDIVSELIIEKENSIYFANGLMHGKRIELEDFIITNDFDSLLIMKQEKLPKEEKCINCGACIEICPVNLNPLLLKRKEYQEKVKESCLKCGLCSYICPSHINFTNEQIGDANE